MINNVPSTCRLDTRQPSVTIKSQGVFRVRSERLRDLPWLQLHGINSESSPPTNLRRHLTPGSFRPAAGRMLSAHADRLPHAFFAKIRYPWRDRRRLQGDAERHRIGFQQAYAGCGYRVRIRRASDPCPEFFFESRGLNDRVTPGQGPSFVRRIAPGAGRFLGPTV
jgi:hypothetical protein